MLCVVFKRGNGVAQTGGLECAEPQIERFEDRSITSEFRSEFMSAGQSVDNVSGFISLCVVYKDRRATTSGQDLGCDER